MRRIKQLDWSKPECSQLVQMQPRKRVYCSMVLYPEVVQDQKKLIWERVKVTEKSAQRSCKRGTCAHRAKSFNWLVRLFLLLTNNVKHAFAA